MIKSREKHRTGLKHNHIYHLINILQKSKRFYSQSLYYCMVILLSAVIISLLDTIVTHVVKHRQENRMFFYRILLNNK